VNEIDPKVLAEIRNIQMLIGRNVLVFQNVEHILKLIHQFKNGSGTFKNLLKRKEKIDELSLGRLTNDSILKKISSKLNSKSDKDIYISYSTLPDDKALNFAIKFFNDINEDRNFLVHNFTVKWKLDNPDHREEAKNWLLKQYQTSIEQREVLIIAMQQIVERTSAMNDFINSEEGRKVLSELKASEEVTFSLVLSQEIY
jgi:hypothetical protein